MANIVWGMTNILPALIHRAAKAQGYTKQADLAKAMQVSPAYLSEMLSGRRTFSPAFLGKAARTLKVPPKILKVWHRQGALQAGWKI